MKPRIASEIAAGRGQCLDCGGYIPPGTPLTHWQVGHRVGVAQAKAQGWSDQEIDALSNLGPSHSKASGRACNQIDGGRAGAAATNRTRLAKSVEVQSNESVFGAPYELTPGGSETFSFQPSDSTDYILKPYAPLPETPEFTGITPLYSSTFEGSQAGREDFLRGAQLLGLGTPENPTHKPLQALQYVIADLLNAQDEDGAPLHVTNGICVPRRASKTTSVWAVALGRISNPDRPDYQVAFTAQTQVKARERFLKDVVAPLERQFPDPATAPFTINRGAATSSITWKSTGGRISILGPNGDSFRGDGYALIILDESQEIEPGDDTVTLLQGIMPTFDTKTINGKPAGQLVVLGTAGKFKGGLFWEQLEKGRKGKAGILEYAADPRTPDYDPDDADQGIEGTTMDPEVWRSAHPGIGSLTPFSVIEAKPDEIGMEAFKREYLGIWPDQTQASFIDMKKWNAGLIHAQPVLPERFSIAVSVHFQQQSAAIVAAWRDENGLAYMHVLDHHAGTEWVSGKLDGYWDQYKFPIAYDDISASTKTEIAAMSPAYPRAKVLPQKWASISTAAAVTMKAINTLSIRHYGDEALSKSVLIATKRGSKTAGMWAFGDSGGDATPLKAGSMALRVYDETAPKPGLMPPPGM
jgi:hypothetical protein